MSIEFLKPILGDDLFGQVAAALEANGQGINLANIAGGAYIPKDKFDEKLAIIKQLQSELEAKAKELEAGNAKLQTVDGLQAQIDKLTADIGARDAELKGVKLDQRIMDAARAAKVRDPRLILALLKRDQITEDEKGNLTGLNEQFEALKKSAPYMFEEDKPAPRGGFTGRQDTLDHTPGDGGNTNAEVNNALRILTGRAQT